MTNTAVDDINNSISRYFWVDLVRVVGIFMVVAVHVARPLYHDFENLTASQWWIANLYAACVKPAVPLFVMVSGFLLLNKNDSLKHFFTRRYFKIGIPLAAWSVFYMIWNILYEKQSYTLSEALLAPFLGPVYFHLWFLYMIAGLYLLVPILRLMIQNNNLLLQWYLVAIWLILVSILPFFAKILDIKTTGDLPSPFYFIGYLVLGSLLGKTPLTGRIRWGATIALMASILTTAILVFLMSTQRGKYHSYFHFIMAPNIIIKIVSMFIVFRCVGNWIEATDRRWIISFVKQASGVSLGLYLLHIMVMEILRNGDLGFKFCSLYGHPAYSIPLTTIVVYMISFAIVRFLQFIPLVRKTVP